MSERTPLPIAPCPQQAWREDFPIDWPTHQYVARRDFTKFLMLTSFPFALAQLWIGVQNWLRHSRGQLPVKAIARSEDVPVGATVSFAYPGDEPCVLVRSDEKTFLAFSQKCTHLGCPVVAEIQNKRFFCPCHLASFDLASGRPLAGPPRRPLPRIILENRAGVLYATGMEVTPV
jgi:Rieske Fe-S protein